MLKYFTKTVLIYGLAPSIGKFVGIFLIPIYTRVFTPEEYGVIDLVYVIIYLLIVLADLNIYNGVGRYFYSAKSEKEKQIIVSTAFWNEVILSIVILFLSIIFSDKITSFLSTQEYNAVFLVALLWLPVSCIFTYLCVIMRYEKKPWLFLTASLVQIIVKVSVSLVTILVFKWGMVGIFWGQITGDLFGSILLFIFLKKYIILSWKPKILKKLLHFSVPLVPAVLVIYFNQSFNRFLLIKYLSLESVGLYAIASKISSIFVLIGVAFRMAWEPFLYESLERKDNKNVFIRIYKLMLSFLCIFGIGITLFSKEILSLLTTKEYLPAYPLVGFLSIYSILNILRLIVGVGPKIVKKTIYDSISIVTGVIVNILTLFIFIPKYGIIGAGYSLCLGGLVTLGIYWYFTYKFYPINYPKILTICSICLMFFTAGLNSMFDINLIFKFSVVTCFALALLFNNKDKVREVLFKPVSR